MVDTFASLIEKERDRLAVQREELVARQKVVQDELEALDREMDAVGAYHSVKQASVYGQPSQGADAVCETPF